MKYNHSGKTIPYSPEWQKQIFDMLPLSNDDLDEIILDHKLEQARKRLNKKLGITECKVEELKETKE